MTLAINSVLFRARYFASGTGAAGLVGAFLWWEVRSLGVRAGVGLSSVSDLHTRTPNILLTLYTMTYPVGVTSCYAFGLLPPSTTTRRIF